jgi:hypothetical protein
LDDSESKYRLASADFSSPVAGTRRLGTVISVANHFLAAYRTLDVGHAQNTSLASGLGARISSVLGLVMAASR